MSTEECDDENMLVADSCGDAWYGSIQSLFHKRLSALCHASQVCQCPDTAQTATCGQSVSESSIAFAIAALLRLLPVCTALSM